MNKNENESMISCTCEKFKQVLFHKILLLGMRAGGHFTALNLRINRCNEPLSYFFRFKTVKIGCLFCMQEGAGDI